MPLNADYLSVKYNVPLEEINMLCYRVQNKKDQRRVLLDLHNQLGIEASEMINLNTASGTNLHEALTDELLAYMQEGAGYPI